MPIRRSSINKMMQAMNEIKQLGEGKAIYPILIKYGYRSNLTKDDFNFIYKLKEIQPIHARKVLEIRNNRALEYIKKWRQRKEQPKPQPQPIRPIEEKSLVLNKPQPQPIRPIEEKPKSPVLPQPKPITTKEAKEVKKESKTKKNMKAKKEPKGMSLFDKVRLTILKARKERIERKIAKIKGINIKK